MTGTSEEQHWDEVLKRARGMTLQPQDLVEMTTFLNYGEVAYQRQGEIIRSLATPQQAVQTGADEIAEAVFRKLCNSGMDMQAR
jgi:hypothetical protein